jgi:3'-phosphoadenosine 5'-phosphosulfate sulfotransferase (PAPS reductase)/FAD synthetase
MLGIMDSSTYNDFSHAQADTCGNLISRYSENEHIDSNIDSNNVLHFTWKAPSTDHYYFVILNAGYDNDVKVDFAASQTGGFMASSTEYQTQTIQLLQTLVVSSIYSTIYTSMPQPPQPTATQSTNNTTPLLALAVIAAVVIGTAFLYSRRKEQPKVTKAEKVDSKTKKAGKNFCIECGKELTQESKFCNNCGAKQP